MNTGDTLEYANHLKECTPDELRTERAHAVTKMDIAVAQKNADDVEFWAPRAGVCRAVMDERRIR